MFLHLKQILTPEEVRTARALLGEDAPWVDGRATAGAQAVERKNNEQLAQDSEACRRLQALVLAALQRDPLLLSAALPRKICNPLFNRYAGGSNHYGDHVDNAIVHSRNPEQWVRTDLSCTLFLSGPEEYDGGELVVREAQGERRFKLPAGDLLLYPGDTLHQVTPVTRGARLASFFWIESMVRDPDRRRLLFDMDMALVPLRRLGDEPALVQLAGTYHCLLRMWADT